MTAVLVHEYLAGGGALDGVCADHAAELRAQGRAMRDAMVADLRRLPGVELIVGETPQPRPEVVERADRVWSVAPETGGMLAAICAAVPPRKWLGCGIEAIRIAGSKRATRERLGAAGVPVPDAAAGDGRFVVKPDDGAGATDTFVLDHFDAAVAAAADGTTIERFVEGETLSLSLLCAHQHVELLSVNRQLIEIDTRGRIALHGVEIAVEPLDSTRGRRLQDLASRVVQALPGLFGIVGIDVVWQRTRGPVVIEVNPRPTTSYVGLSRRLDRNLAADLLALKRDA